MALAYTKEFLVDAAMYRYRGCRFITKEQCDNLQVMTENFYDQVGKDKFRTYCSLDADAIKVYKSWLKASK